MSRQVQARDPAVRRWFFSVAALLGVAFALISEPGTSGLTGWVQHFVQWQLQTLIPMAMLLLVQLAVMRLPAGLRGGQWGALIWTGVISALLFTPLALAVDIGMAGEGSFTLRGLGEELLSMGPPVLVSWLAINAPFVLGFRVSQDVTPTLSDDAQPVEPAFYKELPPGVAGDLICLKAELHYISVVTTQGRALILYNLRDAITDLPASSGIQVHRSYWVAWDHVRALHKAGRQGELELSNGDRVPVSRARLSEVRRALAGGDDAPA